MESGLESKTKMAAEHDAHDDANGFENANGCVNLHDSKEVCESFAFYEGVILQLHLLLYDVRLLPTRGLEQS